MTQQPAVILLSGGLDSATTLAIAREEGYRPYAVSFRYGQRHEVELAAPRQVAAAMGVAAHVVADIDLRKFGGSALTAELAVPHHDRVEDLEAGIPITYVPARNTIFLSFALAWAETLEASDVFIGVNALDYSGYPDCRPEYITAYEKMANLATKAGVEGHQQLRSTPLSLTSPRPRSSSEESRSVSTMGLPTAVTTPTPRGGLVAPATRAFCGLRASQRWAWTTPRSW